MSAAARLLELVAVRDERRIGVAPLIFATILFAGFSGPTLAEDSRPSSSRAEESARSGVSGTETTDGWIPLCNGRDLAGWTTTRPDLWTVENGEIVGRSGPESRNHFLYSARRYRDFELRYEVRLVGNRGNSGVQIRSERDATGQAIGYQVDVGEDYWGSLYHEHGRGMLVHFDREKAAEDPIREDGYNRFEVSCRGHRLTVKVNGVVTVDLEDPEGELEGFVAPQIHSGPGMEVRFRGMEIRPLGEAEEKSAGE